MSFCKKTRIETIGGFAKAVEEAVREKRPELKVSVQRATKNNVVVLTGIQLSKEETPVYPRIYLENFFERYERGMELERIVGEILSVYDERLSDIDCPDAGRLYTDFAYAEDKVLYKLINYEWNKEYLKTVPFIRFHDLAVVFYLFLYEKDGEFASMAVKNDMLEIWGIDTPEEIFRLAHANMQKKYPAKVMKMTDIIEELLGNPCTDQMEGNPQMYVITNLAKIYGAASILYDDLLKGISQKIGEDFFILPSSLHEVLMVPVSAGMCAGELKELVAEVNQTEVGAADILSGSVYRYYAGRDCLEIAAW